MTVPDHSTSDHSTSDHSTSDHSTSDHSTSGSSRSGHRLSGNDTADQTPDQTPGLLSGPLLADSALTGPFPASQKVYLGGTLHPQVRVPARRVTLLPTLERVGDLTRTVPNAALLLPDTSGPYTDAAQTVDLRRGLMSARPWLADHAALDALPGRCRPELDRGGPLPFAQVPAPRPPRRGHDSASGGAARRDHARDGIRGDP
nr:hypothetical protein [Deinococcus sp.]